jgi:hypothetical protein
MNRLVILRRYPKLLAVLSNKPQTTRTFEIINIKFVQRQLSINNQLPRLTHLTLSNG